MGGGVTSASRAKRTGGITGLRSLVSFYGNCKTGCGPAGGTLGLPRLGALLATSRADVTSVVAGGATCGDGMGREMATFDDLGSLSAELIGTLRAASTAPRAVGSTGKFGQGVRNGETATPAAPVSPGAPTPTAVSADRRSCSRRVRRLTNLVSILRSRPDCTPGRASLRVTALATGRTSLATGGGRITATCAGVDGTEVMEGGALCTSDAKLIRVTARIGGCVGSLFKTSDPRFTRMGNVRFGGTGGWRGPGRGDAARFWRCTVQGGGCAGHGGGYLLHGRGCYCQGGVCLLYI